MEVANIGWVDKDTYISKLEIEEKELLSLIELSKKRQIVDVAFRKDVAFLY